MRTYISSIRFPITFVGVVDRMEDSVFSTLFNKKYPTTGLLQTFYRLQSAVRRKTFFPRDGKSRRNIFRNIV